MNFRFLPLLLLGLLAFRCDNDNDDTPAFSQADVINFTTPRAHTALTNLGFNFVVGTDELDIAGTYTVDTMLLAATTVVGDEPIGTTFLSPDLSFANLRPTDRTLDFRLRDLFFDNSSTEAIYTTLGERFNVFAKVTESSEGIPVTTLHAASGTITTAGIADVQYGFIILDDGGNPNNNIIAAGTGRVFIDSDGLAERQ